MPTILSAGVSLEYLDEANAKGLETGSRNNRETILASVNQMKEDISKLESTTIDAIFLHPGNETNWNEFVAKVKSKKWDGITLGGGVRTIPELGDYFTELINLVRVEQPQAVLMFPLLPSDVVPAVRKYVPGAD